jgi:hypothetical protein
MTSIRAGKAWREVLHTWFKASFNPSRKPSLQLGRSGIGVRAEEATHVNLETGGESFLEATS